MYSSIMALLGLYLQYVPMTLTDVGNWPEVIIYCNTICEKHWFDYIFEVIGVEYLWTYKQMLHD